MLERDIQVLLTAEAIVFRESWRLHLEDALARVGDLRGLVFSLVFPPSRAIQAVVYDGTWLGTVYRHHRPSGPEAWGAVDAARTVRLGSFPNRESAAIRW